MQVSKFKRAISKSVLDSIKEKGITKKEAAQRMGIGRSQLDRLIDPQNMSVNLKTIEKAFLLSNKKLEVSLK